MHHLHHKYHVIRGAVVFPFINMHSYRRRERAQGVRAFKRMNGNGPLRMRTTTSSARSTSARAHGLKLDQRQFKTKAPNVKPTFVISQGAFSYHSNASSWFTVRLFLRPCVCDNAMMKRWFSSFLIYPRYLELAWGATCWTSPRDRTGSVTSHA